MPGILYACFSAVHTALGRQVPPALITHVHQGTVGLYGSKQAGSAHHTSMDSAGKVTTSPRGCRQLFQHRRQHELHVHIRFLALQVPGRPQTAGPGDCGSATGLSLDWGTLGAGDRQSYETAGERAHCFSHREILTLFIFLIVMKFTWQKIRHLKPYNSVALSMFKMSRHHHLCLVLKYFHHPKRELHAYEESPPVCPSSRPLATTNMLCGFFYPGHFI